MESTRRTLRDGILVGLIAFAAVALFYSAFDGLAARGAFFTVNLLGKAVFQGLRDPAVLLLPIPPDWSIILSYSTLHLVLSLGVGLFVTALVGRAEQRPAQARAVVLLVAAGFVVTVAAVGALTGAMRALLPWWSIALANACAALLAGLFLLKRRPGLWGRLFSPEG
jgi:hypothetical protein